MLSITRHGVRWLRSGALALTLAAFVPLAIPSAASASTHSAFPPPPGSWDSEPSDGAFTNDVTANVQTNLKTVYKVNFQLGVGVTPTIGAVNRVVAQTTKCADCNAVALGFQVVTTTTAYLKEIHALNVATATNDECTLTCTAVADAFQVVVATDSTAAAYFGQVLSDSQLSALWNIRNEFVALPNSGLTLAQIQSKGEDLADQVVTILADGSYGTGTSSFTSFTEPTEVTPQNQPTVTLYRDLQFDPSAGS